MGKRKPYEFNPDWGVHPGETLGECMAHMRLSAAALGRQIGYTRQHVSNIVSGRTAISPTFALKLEKAGIGPKAEFWMNLEAAYKVHKERTKGKPGG